MPLRPELLLEKLSASLTTALGEELLSLTVHGSWAAGDFHLGRSDLDLLAIIARDPTATTVARLAPVHDLLVREHPEWSDHVEVDYVSPLAVTDVLRARAEVHAMARISPGEPFHLTEASRHYVLNWQAAQAHGRVLVGAAPTELVPVIGWELVQRVALEHLAQWPQWVADMHTPGSQAYAVLTVCRCAALLDTGRQVSKRAGAAYGLAHLPGRASLIEWARDWWYAEGSDDDPGRFGEVVEFVQSVTPAIIDRHAHLSQQP